VIYEASSDALKMGLLGSLSCVMWPNKPKLKCINKP